jgi:hypothetical protein
MKLTGQIQGTGKLGQVVVSRVAGESIARQYNPNVANPNTTGQVAQRAKLKLASQLSAALATSIVMKKEGMVTARNKFVKSNIAAILVSNNVAQISYENIQLTDGNVGLPAISAERDDNKLKIELQEAAPMGISRIVYEVYKKSSEGQLLKMASLVISTAGEDNVYPAQIDDIEGDVVIYAYGMIDANAAATAKFGNYGVQTGTDIARLVATRSLSSSDYRFTETRGVTLFSGSTETTVVPEGSHMVYITAGTGGSVAGDGFVNGRKAVAEGTSVTVVATPDQGAEFDYWAIRSNGGEEMVAQTATYTFTMGQNIVDLIAVFNVPDPDLPGGDDH